MAADHSGLTLRLWNVPDLCDVLADVVIGHYGIGGTVAKKAGKIGIDIPGKTR